MNTIIKKAKGFTLVELMVVIVIVGILAAVAIPKFMDASHKAKASEFPTMLTSIYTGEQAYNAENGSFAADLSTLRNMSGVDVSSTSKWFSYAVAAPTTSTFTGTATVATPFGVALTSDNATVKEDNSKTATANLLKYCPNWK
jgi:prepilin-type N-terminal cleavage/methylation domain-containing protein